MEESEAEGRGEEEGTCQALEMGVVVVGVPTHPQSKHSSLSTLIYLLLSQTQPNPSIFFFFNPCRSTPAGAEGQSRSSFLNGEREQKLLGQPRRLQASRRSRLRRQRHRVPRNLPPLQRRGRREVPGSGSLQQQSGRHKKRSADHEPNRAPQRREGFLLLRRGAESVGCDGIHGAGLLPAPHEGCVSRGIRRGRHRIYPQGDSQGVGVSPSTRTHSPRR